MRTARIAWLLFVTVLKRRLAYRGDLILASLDEIMRSLVALVMLQIYVSKTPNLHGWTQYDMPIPLPQAISS